MGTLQTPLQHQLSMAQSLRQQWLLRPELQLPLPPWKAVSFSFLPQPLLARSLKAPPEVQLATSP